MTRSLCVSLLTALPFVAAACLSSAPPAPPPRFFDPRPAVAAEGPPDAIVQVLAPAYLGHDFVVRVGERELAFDGENRWLAEPRQLVATVLGRALRGKGRPDGGPLVADLELFELDVTAEPHAHVRVVMRDGTGAASRVIDVWAPSADRTPASFATAMAKALADVAAKAGE